MSTEDYSNPKAGSSLKVRMRRRRSWTSFFADAFLVIILTGEFCLVLGLSVFGYHGIELATNYLNPRCPQEQSQESAPTQPTDAAAPATNLDVRQPHEDIPEKRPEKGASNSFPVG